MDTSTFTVLQTGYEHAIREFSAKVQQLTTKTAKTACGREYIRISKLKEWLESETRLQVQGWTEPRETHQITRLLHAAYSQYTGQPRKEQLTGENSCLIVFSILLQLGQGHLIHILKRSHKVVDSHLPIDLPTLQHVFKKEILPYPENLAEDFNKEQWKFCPAKFELGLDMNFDEDHILPIYKKMKINEKGGTATIWQISVMEEFVGVRLRDAVKSARYEDPDYGPCYALVLKAFESEKRAIFVNERHAFSKLGYENGNMIRFLGEYRHRQTHHAEQSERVEGELVILKTTYNILLEFGECDLAELFAKNVPPVHSSEIEAFWRDIFEVADAIRDMHNLRTNNDGMIKEYWGWHADIKPDNILQVQGKFKLADPGFARFVEKPKQGEKEEEVAALRAPPQVLLGGTTTYGAPEQYSHSSRLENPVDQSIDTWSLGCVFSITATFVVLGYQGVQQYSKLRAKAIKDQITSQEVQPDLGPETTALNYGDYFHNGFNVLSAVTSWHDYLRHCMRSTDKITYQVLNLVDRDMLVGRESRSKTSTEAICKELSHILSQNKSRPQASLLSPIMAFLKELDDDPEEMIDDSSFVTVLGSDDIQGNTPQDIQNRKKLRKSHLIQTNHRSHMKVPISRRQDELEGAHSFINTSIQVEDTSMYSKAPSAYYKHETQSPEQRTSSETTLTMSPGHTHIQAKPRTEYVVATPALKLTSQKAMCLINHVFLPPVLPEQNDLSTEDDDLLIEAVSCALDEFRACLSQDNHEAIDTAASGLAALAHVRDSAGHIDESRLQKVMAGDAFTGKDFILPLYIAAQNAAVIIKRKDARFCIETFEVAPADDSVVSTRGRLRRCFPGPAAIIDQSTFIDSKFRGMLLQMLSKLSQETIPEMITPGNTTNPRLITELLASMLGSMGSFASHRRLWKNTREESIISAVSNPWRRSPLWLMIRVTLHRVLDNLDSDTPQSLYKPFMVFFMGYIAKNAAGLNLQSDIVYCMHAKISRRLIKLKPEADQIWLQHTAKILKRSTGTIRDRWHRIVRQSDPASHWSALETLDLDQDVMMDLAELHVHISAIQKREPVSATKAFKPRDSITSYDAKSLPEILGPFSDEYKTQELALLESWVEMNLSEWMEDNYQSASFCTQLLDFMVSYNAIASEHYARNPEALSHMILTLVELWIACDKAVIRDCNLMADYDPAMPQELLQSLVLPLRSQARRLLKVETYLKNRQRKADASLPYVLSSNYSANCFAARYVRQSPRHQKLWVQISESATEQKQRKVQEFRNCKKEYSHLMSRAHMYPCYCSVIRSYSVCKRCTKENEASKISISVHEWPLPSEESKAQSIVFELDVPNALAAWRETVIFMIGDVFQCQANQQDKPSMGMPLQSDPSLKPFFQNPGNRDFRTRLWSSTTRSDKRLRVKDVDENMLFLDCSPRYAYLDSKVGNWMTGWTVKYDIASNFMYKLPSAVLQAFIYRPPDDPNGPPPNYVLARLSERPEHMTRDEFKALASIPLGFHIQWMNILTQLRMPEIEFNKIETCVIFLQVLHQVGPSDESLSRASHRLLEDEDFASALLEALEISLARIKGNWLLSYELAIFIWTSARLLAINRLPQLLARNLRFLSEARQVAFGWMRQLREKAHATTPDEKRFKLKQRVVQLALICISSMDVDSDIMRNVLFDDQATESPESAAVVLIECSITIQESVLPKSEDGDELSNLLRERWKRLSCRVLQIIKDAILNGSQCLDEAILMSWSAYLPGGSWTALSEPMGHWMVTTMPYTYGQKNLEVSYNFLTAQLLVSGLPVARLPSQYESHPLYSTFFGDSAIQAMSTSEPGMQFSAKKSYHGYAMHLGLHERSESTCPDLLLRAVKDGVEYDLLPRRLFSEIFPASFVEHHVHWYNSQSEAIEFRPVEKPWEESNANWELTRLNSKWRLQKQNVYLVDITSTTAMEISRIFSALEKPKHLHILIHHSGQLEVDLPRLRIGFSISEDSTSIESRQFPGMIVDSEQSIGTLVGLQSKLVLRNKQQLTERLVVIPEGPISCIEHNGHVRISVNPDLVLRVQAYRIDKHLGKLVDNGTLQSKLYLCYLHALSSYCLPDPLTAHTGTEQALMILGSGAVRSFNILTADNIKLLILLSHLAPKQIYRVKTNSQMNNLSFLSKHPKFYTSVQDFATQMSQEYMFRPDLAGDLDQLQALDHVDPDLLQKYTIRCSTFRTAGFGAEDFIVTEDSTYKARELAEDNTRRDRVLVALKMIMTPSPGLPFKVSKDLSHCIWTTLQPNVLGSNGPLELREFQFHTSLLTHTSETLGNNWCKLDSVRVMFEGSGINRFQILMWLSTVAYSTHVDMQFIQALGALLANKLSKKLQPPSTKSSFQLLSGYAPDSHLLQTTIRANRSPKWASQAAKVRSENLFSDKKRKFEAKDSKHVERFESILTSQWPCAIPNAPNTSSGWRLESYFIVENSMESVRPLFESWYDNLQFRKYLQSLVVGLSALPVVPIKVPSIYTATTGTNAIKAKTFLGTEGFFKHTIPLVPNSLRDPFDLPRSLMHRGQRKYPDLRLPSFIAQLQSSPKTSSEQHYIEDLTRSLSLLKSYENESAVSFNEDEMKQKLDENLTHSQNRVNELHTSITDLCSNLSAAALGMDPGALLHASPRVSRVVFLQQLTRTRWDRISDSWRHRFLNYANAVVELQRAERLSGYGGDTSHVDFLKELINVPHNGWNPEQHPEWLLVEIESGIVIREVQGMTAQRMIKPSTSNNAVMQLNMGEGKSAVIVPIVALALANGSRLVRVVVAKPQSSQMFEMLVSKLGGLVNRRLYQMPFSRASQLDVKQIQTMHSMYKECEKVGGILLIQPEHILSFQLMGLEQMIAKKESVGRALLDIQHFFRSHSRDIVDESDENFGVKIELIYSLGQQVTMELGVKRWKLIHRVLDLVAHVAWKVKDKLPRSIEVDDRHEERFPKIRIFQPDAHAMFLDQMAHAICDMGVPGLVIAGRSPELRQSIFAYISKAEISTEEISSVEKSPIWTDSTTKGLLLVARGLLANGVLQFVLGSKRWRVNYGLDPKRRPQTQLAVPYQAKDKPSARSEFSHPEVNLIITSLSYYYGGLSDDDLFITFKHLLKSHQPGDRYREWVRTAPKLAGSFHNLTGVNIEDTEQCTESLFPGLRYSKGAIDYFLVNTVFPAEMKEFPSKLSASGWDLGQLKSNVTTGFSGTNDSRHLLPVTVEQLNSPETGHTNALVLENLLRPENSVQPVFHSEDLIVSDAQVILSLVVGLDPPTRVILDVGAQILELSNLEVARAWLQMVPDTEERRTHGAVFADDYDTLCVIDREGLIEPLQVSPLARYLESCLVFLDESHTRGIDLKLPSDYRAAITLGPGLTKDKLVQACMRMRKLGNGQSVVFLMPEEIERTIRTVTKTSSPELMVGHVLEWTIAETCLDLRNNMPLWAIQGRRFETQKPFWNESSAGFGLREQQAKKFMEVEALSLKLRYRPRTATEEKAFRRDSVRNKNLKQILDRCAAFDSHGFNTVTLREEQERERSREFDFREAQREMNLRSAKPQYHKVHEDVKSFVQTGILNTNSPAFQPAFNTLASTAAAQYYDVTRFTQDIFVTADFARTVVPQNPTLTEFEDITTFYRPVQFILTSKVGKQVQHMVIISPYEAQQLFTYIMSLKLVTLHLYSRRLNLGFRPLDNLDLYTIGTPLYANTLPIRSIVQLNLFSGQLYFSSVKHYRETCKFLGVPYQIEDTGAVSIIQQPEKVATSTVLRAAPRDNPVKFFQEFVSNVRGDGSSIEYTHLGKTLEGILLTERDFAMDKN